MPLPCYRLEPLDFCEVGLRRYADGPCPLMPGSASYHQAVVMLTSRVPLRRFPSPDAHGFPAGGASSWFSTREGDIAVADYEWPDRDDPRWPQVCYCGHEFSPGDRFQHWSEALWEVTAAMPGALLIMGDITTLRLAPDGAIWDAFWYPFKGPDGRSLMAKTPGGHEWCIDSRASNCTLPEDAEHRCWVRHGEPPDITVDKDGRTCAAGAGSIQAGAYHGHLRHGVFT